MKWLGKAFYLKSWYRFVVVLGSIAFIIAVTLVIYITIGTSKEFVEIKLLSDKLILIIIILSLLLLSLLLTFYGKELLNEVRIKSHSV